MTREKQRIEQIVQFAFQCYEDSVKYSAFILGAIFADNNPVNVWHSINEQPKIYEDVVLYDSCGNFVTKFCDGSETWHNIVLFHKATMWAYKNDLLPKGGEE